MSWIRWQGVIAFAGIVVALGGVWWLMVDTLAEWTIERTGTAIVGARVDLGAADVTLFPVGIELLALAVTDPDHPMRNAVEITRIAGLVDGLQLLRRKVIIDELAVEGVRFGTARADSGAVEDRETLGGMVGDAAGRLAEAIELPSFELPDPKALLEGEALESLALIESLRAEAQEEMKRWQQKLDALPDQKTFDDYQRRIQQARQGGPLDVAKLAEIAGLAADLHKEIVVLREAALGLDEDLKRLQDRATQTLEARQRDIQRLRDRYGLSPQGLANLSGRLVGPRIDSLVRQGVLWYERLSPFVARVARVAHDNGAEVVERVRGRSVRVRFREDDPLPDFLVRRAAVSIEIEAGAFEGTITNLTPDPDVLGQPLGLSFSGRDLDGVDAVEFDAEFNHVKPEAAVDRISARVRGYRLNEVALSESERWPITLASGRADLRVEGEIRAGALTADLGAELHDASLSAEFADDSAVANALSRTLEEVDAFELSAGVSGTLVDFDVTIRSSLDRLLQQAAESLISEQMQRLESLVRRRVDGALEGPLAELDSQLGGLASLSEEITNLIDLGDGVLREASSGGNKGRLKLPSGLKLPGGFKLP